MSLPKQTLPALKKARKGQETTYGHSEFIENSLGVGNSVGVHAHPCVAGMANPSGGGAKGSPGGERRRMAEQEPVMQLTPERLAEYQGPKLGKHLRGELKEQVALLYEKLMILRLVDSDFERELEQLGALEFLDRYTEHLREEQERMRSESEQSLERLRKTRRANEEAPTK